MHTDPPGNCKPGPGITGQKGVTRREFSRKLAALGAGLPLVGTAIPSMALNTPALDPAGLESTAPPGAAPRKIHIFSKHLQFLGYEEMAKASTEAGVDGVDLTVRPRGHVLPENVERDLPLAAGAVRNAGLELVMMTTRITDPDDPLTEKILKVASGLGIRYYRMGYYRYDKNTGIEMNLELIRQKMAGLVALNEKYGIHGAYQNHAGSYFGAPLWDLWQVIGDMNPEWTGCQYDIRHAIVEGAQSWPLAMELLKEHIRCMAIKDFVWNREKGKWHIKNVPVGEGMVDFKSFFERVQAFSISGPISLHIEYPLYPDENMPLAGKREAAIRTIQHDVQALRGLLTYGT